MIDAWIPKWDKEYGGEEFLEYFTIGLSGMLYQGLMHRKEIIPHILLIEIMEIDIKA